MRPRPQEVELELFTHRFGAIASEMGEMLERTALSTNVRERLDFSCAVLDPGGRLVVNAPHIPVHLGALGLCVRTVRDALAERGQAMEAGDTVVTNHPGFGGSHLPDVTLITPVFDREDVLLGYVASRSHHAEIGGTRPGSMPPDAASLGEEGVVLAPTFLVRRGQSRRPELRRALETWPFPSRSVLENLADLDAALAANHRGAKALSNLASSQGTSQVHLYMALLQERSAEKMRGALRDRAAQGIERMEAVERLDDGTPLAVRLELTEDGTLEVDFTGTGRTHAGNLNATRAIVQSAVLYVARVFVGEDLPLDEGLLEPVRITIPAGTLLDPDFSGDPFAAPAVVGGNVETSQRLVDVLLKALGLVAGSQGTMNNLLFGNEHFGYYETICGGAGAGPGFDGADAVHTHMTNTRITDPEILERRYPVRLERFAIRRGSGGAGLHRGGDGAVRQMRFLQAVQLSILAQHRHEVPYGMEGGQAGSPGRQRLERADGRIEPLPGIARAEVLPGDLLVMETPGGGGWGKPQDPD